MEDEMKQNVKNILRRMCSSRTCALVLFWGFYFYFCSLWNLWSL